MYQSVLQKGECVFGCGVMLEMAILNPCCCITLRTGAKIVAAVDILVALILLIIFISDLTFNIDEQYGKHDFKPKPLALVKDESKMSGDISCEDDLENHSVAGEQKQEIITNTAYVTTGVWTILTVFLATNVGISALLYTGARNYSIKRCKWWFYIQTVITSLSLVILILILCFQVAFALVVLDLIIHLVYRMYTLWVVYLFIGELTYLDTLCSLNSNKKGGVGGGILYPANLYTNGSSMGSTSPTSYDYYAHTNIYANTPYQQQQEHQPYPPEPPNIHPHHHHHNPEGINGIVPPTMHHYNSSDDGLPPKGPLGGGGIDNPTYLP